jgi:hypothetical protein
MLKLFQIVVHLTENPYGVITETNLLMQCWKVFANCYENYRKDINTLCRRIDELFYVKASGSNSNHGAVKG